MKLHKLGIGSERADLSAAQPCCVQNVSAADGCLRETDGSPAGLAGCRGMRVTANGVYNLTVYVRAVRGTTLTAELQSGDGGVVYARAALGDVGYSEQEQDGWRKLHVLLHVPTAIALPPSGDGTGRLVLWLTEGGVSTATTPSTVWLGWVSLFPADAWRGRRNGLRPDLAEMVNAMRPGFVRFPGGSFVEGETLDTAFWWKRTVRQHSQCESSQCPLSWHSAGPR